MPVSAYAIGDRFTIRVVKYLNTNPDNKWANSYEFAADVAGSEDELLQLAEAVVGFEAEFHYTETIFDRVLISTWEPDSKPYNPTSFVSSTLTAIGLAGEPTNHLSLNQALSVARIAAYGRFGHIFYRNCVAEGNVSAPAGVTVLNDRSVFQTRIDDALTASGLGDYVGVGASGGMKMVLINADGDQVRPVHQLRVQGMSALPLDHAWFNRTTITVP